jgi:hypothetical protein
MGRLDDVAVEGTPLAGDLREAAPGLTTLARNLPAFNRSATTGLQALGTASVTGRRALRKGHDEIRQLGKSTQKSFATADDLNKFLEDIDDPRRAVEVDARAAEDTGRDAPTGYTGMEGLLNYLYYQTLSINQFDEIGHLLHFSILEVATSPCSEYNAGTYEGERGVPDADGTGATTDIRDAHRCVAWLGDRQPDINEPLGLPPYDPSVCPDGSTDTSLCDPAGSAAATGRARGGATVATGGPAAGGEGGSGSGDEAAGGGAGSGADPEAPGPEPPSEQPIVPGGGPLLPDLGGVVGGRGGEDRGDAESAATGDILGYLFGN